MKRGGFTKEVVRDREREKGLVKGEGEQQRRGRI